MTTAKQEDRRDLRDIRTRVLGYTQERMAQELHVSLRSYCRYEASGPNRTAMALATRLADAAVDSRTSSGYIQPISKEMVRKNTFEASVHTAT